MKVPPVPVAARIARSGVEIIPCVETHLDEVVIIGMGSSVTSRPTQSERELLMVLKPLTLLAIGIAAAFSITSADAQWRPYAGVGWYGGAYAGAYDSAFAGAYDSAGYGYGYSGAYGYAGGYGYRQRATWPGTYYSYGADRSNPSVDPSGFDQDNARDFQLNGHN